MINQKVQMKVRLTFVNDLLGTAPGNKELYETYIASKAPDVKTREEEVASFSIEESQEKKKTVFLRNKAGEPILKAHNIRGFFKSACKAMRDDEESKASKLKNYKKQIDGNIFVYQDLDDRRNLDIEIKDYGTIGTCQRPLRASTPMGDAARWH